MVNGRASDGWLVYVILIAYEMAASVKRHDTADIDRVKTEKKRNFDSWTTTYRQYWKRTTSKPTLIADPSQMRSIPRTQLKIIIPWVKPKSLK